MIAAYNNQWLDRGTWIGAIAYPLMFGSPNLRLTVYCGILMLTTLALIIMATTLISLCDQYHPGPIRATSAVKHVSLSKCFHVRCAFCIPVHCSTVHCRFIAQWNPSITDTFGEQCFGLYTEVVAFIDGVVLYTTVHLGPGCLAVI